MKCQDRTARGASHGGHRIARGAGGDTPTPRQSALTVGAAAADQAKSCGRPHEWTDANIRSSTADPNELFVSLEKYDSEEMASSRETPTTIIRSNTLSNQPLHEKYQVTTNHAQWLCSMYLYRTIFHRDTWTRQAIEGLCHMRTKSS